jgi:hypothetical protein
MCHSDDSDSRSWDHTNDNHSCPPYPCHARHHRKSVRRHRSRDFRTFRDHSHSTRTPDANCTIISRATSLFRFRSLLGDLAAAHWAGAYSAPAALHAVVLLTTYYRLQPNLSVYGCDELVVHTPNRWVWLLLALHSQSVALSWCQWLQSTKATYFELRFRNSPLPWAQQGLASTASAHELPAYFLQRLKPLFRNCPFRRGARAPCPSRSVHSPIGLESDRPSLCYVAVCPSDFSRCDRLGDLASEFFRVNFLKLCDGLDSILLVGFNSSKKLWNLSDGQNIPSGVSTAFSRCV